MNNSLFNWNTTQDCVGYNINDGSNYAEYKSVNSEKNNLLHHSNGELKSVGDDNTNDLPVNDNISEGTYNKSLKDIESHIETPFDLAVKEYNKSKHKFVDILAHNGYAEPYKIIEDYEKEGFSSVLSPIIKPIKKQFHKNTSNDIILQRTRQTIKFVQKCQIKYWIINAIIRITTLIIILCVSYYFVFKSKPSPDDVFISGDHIPLKSPELSNS